MRQARASAAARAASEKCFERMSGPQFGGRQRKARHAGAAVSSLSWITETIPPGQAPRQLRATKTPNSIRIALVVGRRNIADAAEPAREICAVSGTGRAPCAASGISAPEATRIATFPRPPRIRASFTTTSPIFGRWSRHSAGLPATSSPMCTRQSHATTGGIQVIAEAIDGFRARGFGSTRCRKLARYPHFGG